MVRPQRRISVGIPHHSDDAAGVPAARRGRILANIIGFGNASAAKAAAPSQTNLMQKPRMESLMIVCGKLAVVPGAGLLARRVWGSGLEGLF